MQKGQILVVDDEKDILDLLHYNLKREGHRIYTAESGEEGVELARAENPDLIILDLMLPGINGIEVCRLLKNDDRTRGIPVIMLTARGAEIDEVVGLEVGASDYITKPFSVQVLLARVRNIFKNKDRRASIETAASGVRAGEFILKEEEMRFIVKGKPVDLTKREFGIVTCLFKNSGAVVGREKLVNEAWGRGCIVSSASINMQIRSIRRKLGRRRQSIQTVRGVGYRFASES